MAAEPVALTPGRQERVPVSRPGHPEPPLKAIEKGSREEVAIDLPAGGLA
jgi:hypothetical protein